MCVQHSTPALSMSSHGHVWWLQNDSSRDFLCCPALPATEVSRDRAVQNYARFQLEWIQYVSLYTTYVEESPIYIQKHNKQNSGVSLQDILCYEQTI